METHRQKADLFCARQQQTHAASAKLMHTDRLIPELLSIGLVTVYHVMTESASAFAALPVHCRGDLWSPAIHMRTDSDAVGRVACARLLPKAESHRRAQSNPPYGRELTSANSPKMNRPSILSCAGDLRPYRSLSDRQKDCGRIRSARNSIRSNYSLPFSFSIFARIIFSLYSRKRHAPMRQVTVAITAVRRYCEGRTVSTPSTIFFTVMEVKTTMAIA